ncbi:MAG: hypothetical protein KAK00_03810 [Nanoarchaeota archaeon]|nr:hypothetical protein [Nanoarchaeota archaeon]
MTKKLSINDEITDFLLYNSPNGDVRVEIFLHNETVWLNQNRMAELFGVGIPAISKHLENIFLEGELDKDSTVSKMEIVQKDSSFLNENHPDWLESNNIEVSSILEHTTKQCIKKTKKMIRVKA